MFLATKLEAHRDRGAGDLHASRDLEDVIAVVDGRPELLEEVTRSSGELREYLAAEVGRLLDEPAFRPALAGHLPPDPTSQARAGLVLQRLHALTQRRARRSPA